MHSGSFKTSIVMQDEQRTDIEKRNEQKLSVEDTQTRTNEQLSGNSRIAKNTLFLYFRMIVVMLVSLYTSRMVLATLGVEDYGIYQVVGGLVAMFTILTGSLSVSSSRYLTYELGRGDAEQLKKTFATVRALHIILAISIFVISEILAIWFLNTKLNIPANRMHAATWALHCSILSFSILILNVPYNASIISHEKMSTFAYLSILDVVTKLGIVYLLYISPIDRLIFYALLLLASTILYQTIYVTYCFRKFTECRSKPAFDREIVKGIASFVGWTFWGNSAVVVKDQGVVMLLNIFFGPVVNAAQGIAMQVDGVVTRFISGFMTALQPQITKSYASNNISRLNDLLVRGSKFSFFLTILLIIPIINNTEVLLNAWLVEVPEHAVAFTNLILVYTFINCFTTPIFSAVLATGKIKVYEIALTVLYTLNILFSYLALKLGMSPESVFVLAILFKMLVFALLINRCYSSFTFDWRAYVKMFLKRVVPIAVFGCVISLIFQVFDIRAVIDDFIYNILAIRKSWITLIVSAVAFELLLIPFIWIVGLQRTEREFVKNAFVSRIPFLKKR